MADTRRAVAATTFYPLTQDSHYTNVPPIIGPQSAALPGPSSLLVLLNHFNQNHANRRENQIPKTPPGRVTVLRRCDRFP